MSNITLIYDKLREQIPLILTGKTEIPNPYSLTDNMIQFLENGWGIAIRDATNGVINTYCLDSELRTFEIIVSKIVYNLDGTNTNIVADSKSILEDIRKVRNDLLAFDQFLLGDYVQNVTFQSASGIEFVNGDKFNLFYASINFGIEFTENILNS